MSLNPTPESNTLVLSQIQIQRGVDKVANILNEKFIGSDVVAIVVVPGGMFFASDLLRKVRFDVKIDIISCPHIPGNRENHSNIVFLNNINITGKHVLLIDDALESGSTMNRLVQYIKCEHDVLSTTVCTLFVKTGHIDVGTRHYYAYQMEQSSTLVGYGLPFNEQFRNLPYVSCISS